MDVDYYESEINFNYGAWLKNQAEHFDKLQMILLDYGYLREEYYHEERNCGTIMCHHDHFAHENVFLHLGEQDITVHVDFSAVIDVAEKNNLQVVSFSNQATFLIEHGLLDEFAKIDPQSERFYKAKQAILRLTSPNEMGELFKVLVLFKD